MINISQISYEVPFHRLDLLSDKSSGLIKNSRMKGKLGEKSVVLTVKKQK